MARQNQEFQTVRSEGGLLPPDLLRRVLDSARGPEGTHPEDYDLKAGERFGDVIPQSWTRLCRIYADFQRRLADLPTEDSGLGLTNERWTLPLLRELGFGPLPTTAGPTVNDRTYAINRFLGPVPIHLVGWNVSLDRRSQGVRGASWSNPHGLVQEFLNRSDDHLWAVVSNGRLLRILRDNQTLSRQSFLEFDLSSMFEGEVYSDFVLLWMVAHATRMVPPDGAPPEHCLLEKWMKEAEEQGTRALGELRGGVEKALQILGAGFTGHPRNVRLRGKLRDGSLTPLELHGQLLRLVYRIIFLFVAEDRLLEGQPVLHPEDSSPEAKEARRLYRDFYSMSRLRDMATRIRGSHHGDLWCQFRMVCHALSDDPKAEITRKSLALPVLGSMLWDPESIQDLVSSHITNADFLDALRHLAFTRQDRNLRPVDFRNLAAEELGGIYEGLLALSPRLEGGASYSYEELAGSERKTTGSYYTPDSLVQCLLDSALDPVVEARLNEARKLAKRPGAGTGRKTAPAEAASAAWEKVASPRGGDGAFSPEEQELLPVWYRKVRSETGWGVPLDFSFLAEKALLSLKICDPACGSGHFLVGAAHRLARHLSRIRSEAEGESEPSPLLYQHALRDVIGKCLYGVDLNPMAAELCRVSLWLEALEPGKPLSFLDHHIRVGNSLLGTTPEFIRDGIPDEAFSPLEGDEKTVCAALKKRNKSEKKKVEVDLFSDLGVEDEANLSATAQALEDMPDDSPKDVRAKCDFLRQFEDSQEYRREKALADAWCAAFLFEKRIRTDPGDKRFPSREIIGITQRTLRDLSAGRPLPEELSREILDLAKQYRFFHWHLAFPEVFGSSKNASATKSEIGRGLVPNILSSFDMVASPGNPEPPRLSPTGFDCILGNPPWEHVELKEKEWFADKSPEILKAGTGSKRKEQIKLLGHKSPGIYREYLLAVRSYHGICGYIGNSGAYPLCGRGRINLYSVFAELMRRILKSDGRLGCILPSGISTDDTTKFFFQDLTERGALVSLFDFENRSKLFPEVDSRMKFCLLTLRGRGESGGMGRSSSPSVHGERSDSSPAEFVFFAHSVEDLQDPDRRFTLSAEDIALLNPNTRTCPIFRSPRDAELTKAIYRRVPVLLREARDGRPEENPWGIQFKQGLFNMTSDSHLFRTREQLVSDGWQLDGNVYRKKSKPDMFGEVEEACLPLYEAKMIHQFDHRWATYEGEKTRDFGLEEKQDPSAVVFGRYWVHESKVKAALNRVGWKHPWLLGWRDICRSTDERTVIAGIIPRAAVGNKIPLIFISSSDTESAMMIYANLNSLVVDYCARQKMGGTTLNYFIFKQIPSILSEVVTRNLPLIGRSAAEHVGNCVKELVCVSEDMMPLVDPTNDRDEYSAPFRWDEERRFLLRAELDAAFFHLYLPSEPDGNWRMARKSEGCPQDETPEQLETLRKHFPTPREAVAYILDTFPIVRKKEEAKWGEYRSRRVILEIYDAMQEAIRTGRPYETRLDPPPADPRCCHGN